jgi:hypothetical protein
MARARRGGEGPAGWRGPGGVARARRDSARPAAHPARRSTPVLAGPHTRRVRDTPRRRPVPRRTGCAGTGPPGRRTGRSAGARERFVARRPRAGSSAGARERFDARRPRAVRRPASVSGSSPGASLPQKRRTGPPGRRGRAGRRGPRGLVAPPRTPVEAPHRPSTGCAADLPAVPADPSGGGERRRVCRCSSELREPPMHPGSADLLLDSAPAATRGGLGRPQPDSPKNTVRLAVPEPPTRGTGTPDSRVPEPPTRGCRNSRLAVPGCSS